MIQLKKMQEHFPLSTLARAVTLGTSKLMRFLVMGLVVPLACTNAPALAATFAPPIRQQLVAPSSVAAGDFNADGKMDLALAQGGAEVILLGNGNGTFSITGPYQTNWGPSLSSIVATDLNGDGRLDLVRTNCDGNAVTVRLGNGDGTFQPAVDYPVGAYPVAIAAADFNGDGKVDLAVADLNGNSVSLLRGNGNGTFQPKIDIATGSYPYGVSTGDFNGDGRPDLVVANGGDNSVSIHLGIGDGTFQPRVNYPTVANPQAVLVLDCNNDGKLDLAVVNSQVSILLGNGNGTFQPKVDYPASGMEIVSGDFNRDGLLDLATSDGMILPGKWDGTLGPAISFGRSGESLVAADFNGDSRLDLAVSNYWGYDLSVLINCDIDVAPLEHNFDTVMVGSLATFDFTITNTGAASLNGGYMAVAGPDSSQFSVAPGGANPCPDLAPNLAGGGSCTVTVAFSPATAGPKESTLEIVSADPARPRMSVPLRGNGVLPIYTLTQASMGTGGGSVKLSTGPTCTGECSWQFSSITALTLTATPDANSLSAVSWSGCDTVSGNLCSLTLNASRKVSALYTAKPATTLAAFEILPAAETGASPSAVATGDFNGDGRLDQVVANKGAYSVSVFLGNGDGSFQAKVDYGVGSAPAGVVAGDMNEDGRLDLAVVNSGTHSLSILLGNGDGTFQPKADFPVGFTPAAITAGDFNRDGRLDLAVANSAGNNISILLGNGNGTLQTKVDYSVGNWPVAIATADVNNDGRLDLAVTNYSDNTISVLPGGGDGSFQPKADYSTGNTPVAVTTGDFNGDGRRDLAVANYNGNSVSILLGSGGGSFLPRVDYSAGSNPSAVTALDFNDDGKLDLAIANATGGNVAFLLGNGDGTLRAPENYSAGSAQAMSLADFNTDAKPDLALVNGSGNTVTVLLNQTFFNLSGTFKPKVDYATGSYYPDVLIAGDFNHDGLNDLAVHVGGTGRISTFLGNGNGTLQPGVEQYTLGNSGSGSHLAMGDLNGDGNLDLVLEGWSNSNLDILLGNGDGTFQPTFFSEMKGRGGVVLADFNNDGKIDLVTGYGEESMLALYPGNGDGSFQAKRNFGVGISPHRLEVGDFNGDGRLDLAVAQATEFGGRVLTILLGNNDGTFQAQANYAMAESASGITSGDFNGDGKLDLALSFDDQGVLSIFLGNGDGTLQPRVDYSVGGSPCSVLSGDLNNDGKLDLAVANFGGNTISTLLGNGNGTFQAKSDYPAGTYLVSLTTADLNGDGKLDLAVTNYSGNTVSVLINNNAPAPHLLVTPAAGDFGTIFVGNRAEVVFTLTNIGSLPLTTSYASVDSPFNITFGGPKPCAFWAGATLAPAASCTVVIGLQPVDDSVIQGSLRITTDDPMSPTYSVPLTGTGEYQLFPLDLTMAGSGTGTVSFSTGGSTATSTSQTVIRGTTVTLTPTPGVNAHFAGWQGCDLVKGNDCVLTMNSGRNVTATFAAGTMRPSAFNIPLDLLTLAYSPWSVTRGDFNNDGKADLALANYDNDNVTVLLGNGDGTFQKPAYYPVGSKPMSVFAADANGDGKVDLAVANYGSGSVSFLSGNGNGTFQAKYDVYTGSGTNFVALADFSGDGIADMVVSNYTNNCLSFHLGIGNGLFRSPPLYYTINRPMAVAPGDFNGDGKLEVAVASFGVTPQDKGYVTVIADSGYGNFQPVTSFQAGVRTWSVTAGDLNGDGKADLIVANEGDFSFSIYFGSSGGTLQGKLDYPNTMASAVAIGDYTGDGLADLVVAGRGMQTLTLLADKGDGTFRSGSNGTGADPAAVIMDDFNSDGNLDLAVANNGDNTVSLLLGEGNGRFGLKTDFAVGLSPQSLTAGDFNGDGKRDLAVANYDGNTVSILPGDGNGTFQAKVDYPAGIAPKAIISADFNGDNLADLAVTNANADTVSILLGTGSGSFLAKTDYPTGTYPHALSLGDFNGDGTTDLAVVNLSDSSVSLFLGNGDGSFQPKVDSSVGNLPGAIAAGDLDNDGKLDLAVAGETLAILVGNGDGTFQQRQEYGVGTGAIGSLTMSDFSGDGNLDLALTVYDSTTYTNTLSVLLGNGNGSLQSQTEISPINYPRSLIAGDLNGDDKADLVVLNLGVPASIIVCLNNTATSTLNYAYYFPSIKDSDAIGWENYLSVQAKEPVTMAVTIRVYDMFGVLKGTYIYSNTDPLAKGSAIAPNARVAQRPSWIAGSASAPVAIEGSVVVETSVPAIASINCIANFYQGFSLYEAAKPRLVHNFPKAYDGLEAPFYQVYMLGQNIYDQAIDVTVKLFGKTAADPGHGATRTYTIPAHGTLKVRPSEVAPHDPATGAAINFSGSVVISAAMAIPAMCRFEAGQETLAIYESTVEQPALSFPVIKDGRFGGTLDFQNFVSVVNFVFIQNPDETPEDRHHRALQQQWYRQRQDDRDHRRQCHARLPAEGSGARCHRRLSGLGPGDGDERASDYWWPEVRVPPDHERDLADRGDDDLPVDWAIKLWGQG